MIYLCIILFIGFVNCEVPIVNTTLGLIRGLEGNNGDYFMYLGIPYGLVDTGNPFGPSLPHPAFEGTFEANDDSAICPQVENDVYLGSLDCLHLSVFVPARSEGNLPVLIFIHGGGFETGSYGRTLYGPRFLVRHDVILVTLNYRLGPYGYMCTDHPRVPGNQALKDQMLALNWVHENIRNFGGDPNKVTLSGNSAGAMSVDFHIMNGAPKVFQRAILQSGVSFLPSFPKIDKRTPLSLSEHFGFKTDDVNEALDFLADVHPSDIISAWRELNLVFRPCIETVFDDVEPFLTENWVAKEVIPTKDLNLMIGFNENEALVLYLTPESDLSGVVEESLSPTFDVDHEEFTGSSEVRNFFFGDDDIDFEQFKNAIDLRSDLSFVHNSVRAVKRYLKSDVEKIYLYHFSYDGERNLIKSFINTTLHGAVHADELGYLYDMSYYDTVTYDDQLTIDRMTEMWTNFVKFGDPTPTPTENVPLKWTPITPNSAFHYINIDKEITAGTSVFNDRIAFWDLFLELNGHLQRFLLDNI